MGAQKKGAATTGGKRKGQFKTGPKQKTSQKEMNEDFDSSDCGSDVDMQKMAVSKKTPNKEGQTPKQNPNAKRDERVSFQLQGKGKVDSPASAKGFNKKVNPTGQTALREFPGMKPDPKENDDADMDDDDKEHADNDDGDVRKTLLNNQGKKVPKSKRIDKTKKDTSKPAQSPNKQGEKALEAQKRRERDLKTLFVRGIPKEVTAEELKAISSDVVDVKIPKHALKKEYDMYFAFLEFASEKKAEENYTLLQNKKLRGQAIFLDFAGEKSKNRPAGSNKVNDMDKTTINKKKLIVSGYPEDTTVAEISPLFPKAVDICLKRMRDSRSIAVLFNNEQDASEALTANSKIVVHGTQATVSYAMEKLHPKRKRSKQNQKNQPPAKKQNIAFVPGKKPAPSQEPESSDDDSDEE